MFLSPSRYDGWLRLSTRALDEDLRYLLDLIWRPAWAHCDGNGVLTLTPSYQYYRSPDRIDLDIEIPGVSKGSVAVEVQGDRLKIVAAKYSQDKRSSICARARARERERTGVCQELPNSQSKDDKRKAMDNKAPALPSIVYKLYLRISSRANIDAISASHVDNGHLQIVIPIKEEVTRKIVINSKS